MQTISPSSGRTPPPYICAAGAVLRTSPLCGPRGEWAGECLGAVGSMEQLLMDKQNGGGGQGKDGPYGRWALVGDDGGEDEFQNLMVIEVFRGAVDDEWSMHLDWCDLTAATSRMKDLWAEAWVDHGSGLIECCVRELHIGASVTTADGTTRRTPVYGPAPEWPRYLRMRPAATLQDLAYTLEFFPFDGPSPSPFEAADAPLTTLDAARARSRFLKSGPRRLALAMALHARLGAASAAACLGEELLREVAARWV